MLSIALDTCLLAGLDEPDGDLIITAIETAAPIIRLIKSRQIRILVDSQGRILGEYERHLERRRMGQSVISLAQRYGCIEYRSEKLSIKRVEALLAAGFDDDDLPFINCCYRANGWYVTSEVKHLDPERKAIIKRHSGVEVLSLCELRDRLEGRRSP